MVRIFLALVGTAYAALAVWCSLMPSRTSNAVGFTLQPGSGQSEYLTVYGGLQFALGVAFLWPLVRPEKAGGMLSLCLIIHGVLVMFRAARFILYKGIPTTPYLLAATEWLIVIGAGVIWWIKR